MKPVVFFGFLASLLMLVQASTIQSSTVFEFAIGESGLEFWTEVSQISNIAKVTVDENALKVKIEIDSIDFLQKTFLKKFLPTFDDRMTSSNKNSLSKKIFNHSEFDDNNWPQDYQVHPLIFDLINVAAPRITSLTLSNGNLFDKIAFILPKMIELSHLVLESDVIELFFSKNIQFSRLQSIHINGLPLDLEKLKTFFKIHSRCLRVVQLVVDYQKNLPMEIIYKTGMTLLYIGIQGNWNKLSPKDLKAIRDMKTLYFTQISPSDLEVFSRSTDGFFGYSDYKLGNPLGKGCFGTVFKAMRISDGKLFAIKESCTPDSIKFLKRECKYLSKMEHQNIVSYEESFFYKNCFYMVMEYIEGKNLINRIRPVNTDVTTYSIPIIPLDLAQKILKQLLEAFSHAHSFGIVYSDLKPENILIDSEDNIKLLDFGCGAIQQKESANFLKGIGNLETKAPELFNGNFSTKSDIWSIGALVFRIILYKSPFSRCMHDLKINMDNKEFQLPTLSQSAETAKELYRETEIYFLYVHCIFVNDHNDLRQYDTIHPAFADFVDVCMQINPESRPTADELLDHQLFKEKLTK